MSTDDQLIDVGGLLAGEFVEAQVGQDEQSTLYRPIAPAILRGPLWV